MIKLSKCIKDKINWLLKYCSEYPGHEFMYDERLDNTNVFNIDLGVEKYILQNIDNVHLVLLTGDAGDGKSRILFNLKKELDNSWIYINDFSEFDQLKQRECIENIYNAIEYKKRKYIVAGNSGIFINAVVQFKYGLLGKLKNRENCLVLNFKNRNVAESSAMFSKVVKEFLNYYDFEKCSDCKLCNNCPFLYNLEKMNNSKTIERIRIIFDTLFLIGIHVTFRDLLSLLSYFVTKGMDCNQLIRQNTDLKEIYFYNNIFSYNDYTNIILSELSEIDIAKTDINDFDYNEFNGNYNEEELGVDSLDYNKLKELKMLKRHYYFTNPEKLRNYNSLYSLLPVEYLSQYKELLRKIKEIGYIDSMDDDYDVLRKFELGLNKISNPNRSNAQLVLFDSPPITSKDVRLEYSSGEQLRLIFCTPQFYFTNGECNSYEESCLEDLNSFYCFVYYESETFENLPIIKIDYSLFNQIMLAQENIFTDKNVKLSDNVHIQSFTKAIFDNINSNPSVTVTWTGARTKDIIDFNMAFVKPSGLGMNRNKKNRILISSTGR